MREYFWNASENEDIPILMSGLRGYPELPNKNPKLASLVSLLRAMNEKDIEDYISLKGQILADEILTTLLGPRGGTWMTNFGMEKADEHFDAATLWSICRRFWAYNGLAYQYSPLEMAKTLPEGAKWDEQLAPSKKLMDVDVSDIVMKHLIPYPQLRFEYVGYIGFSVSRNELQGGWLGIPHKINLELFYDTI
jgi:hypothetical protein